MKVLDYPFFGVLSFRLRYIIEGEEEIYPDTMGPSLAFGTTY